MHVPQLLNVLALAEDVEIIISWLPEGARQIVPEHHLVGRFLFSAAPAGDTLLEHLHHQGNTSLAGFADQQVRVFRHDYITPDGEILLLPDFVQHFQKQVATACRSEELLASITATGDEVSIT